MDANIVKFQHIPFHFVVFAGAGLAKPRRMKNLVFHFDVLIACTNFAPN